MKQERVERIDGLECEWMDLNRALIRNPDATYGLTVCGDDATLGICDGDLLIVDREATPRHGEPVIVEIEGELIIRQYKMPFALAGHEHPAPVFGVITHRIHSYRKEAA